MCHFITLVVPSVDRERIGILMRRHGRRAAAIANPCLQRVMQPGEAQYLTTPGHCDCGTILGQRAEDDRNDAETERIEEAARLRQRGWSGAKVERWLEDKARADNRPRRAGPDSLELWASVLRELLDVERLPQAGLFVHAYRGTLSVEQFDAVRREVAYDDLEAGLAEMGEDELMVVRRRR